MAIGSKKLYESIARSLLVNKPRRTGAGDEIAETAFMSALYQWQDCCTAVANALEVHNDLFSRERFLEACGHTEE